MNGKEILDLMINGIISGVTYYEGKDNFEEKVICAKKYLDGKGVFYESKEVKNCKYGKGISFTPITDKKYIDAIEEYLYCIWLFGDITKAEEKLFMKTQNKNLPKPYYYYISKEEMDNIRFDLIRLMSRETDLEVQYDKGMVIIS